MTEFDKNFLDVNGLVLPNVKSEEKPSDNGVLFTSIVVVLGFPGENYVQTISDLFLEKGLLPRWKGNNFDQSQWDDYLGVGAACFYLKEKNIPRDIIKYGVKHFGRFDTDGKQQGADWLIRFPQVWTVLFVAAFPALKWLFYPAAYLISLFMKPAMSDGSGTQLAWLYMHTMANAFGFGFKKKYNKLLWQQKKTVYAYYGKGHPIIALTDGLPFL